MNYLAHLYLSGNNPEIMLGNLIGDYVKGNLDNSVYTGDILLGLKLHRAIDTFTDQNPITQNSRKYLQSIPRRFSKILIDIFYDHFLSLNWNKYHQQPLADFSKQAYQLLKDYEHLLPLSFSWVNHYMPADDWLNSYGQIAGIADAIERANYRLRKGLNITDCLNDLKNNYQQLKDDFEEFLPVIKSFTDEKITILS